MCARFPATASSSRPSGASRTRAWATRKACRKPCGASPTSRRTPCRGRPSGADSKRNLLIATGGATAFTLLFATSSALPMFTLAWVGYRLTQSIGWSALVKVSSRWFSYSRYGTIAAILTCSYLLGDAAARGSMGLLLQRGVGWRGLFLFGASVAGLLFLANLLFLRESRTDEGYPEAIANPRNVFSGAESRPRTFAALVLPLLRSRAFLMVCLLSLATTMVRETFNTW